MKKSIKIMLIGAGVAAAGFFAYSVFKEPEEPTQEKVPPVSTFPKEYVERRRTLMREKISKKATAQEAAVPAAEPSATGEIQEEVSAPAQEIAASADEAAEPPVAEEESEKPAE